MTTQLQTSADLSFPFSNKHHKFTRVQAAVEAPAEGMLVLSPLGMYIQDLPVSWLLGTPLYAKMCVCVGGGLSVCITSQSCVVNQTFRQPTLRQWLGIQYVGVGFIMQVV